MKCDVERHVVLHSTPVAAVTGSAGGAGGDGNGTGAEPPGGPHGHLRPPLLPVPRGL
jgi:hypothetical protein